jgi:hypothetical protein
VDWSKPHPMDAEENMLRNAAAIKTVNPDAITWVFVTQILRLVTRWLLWRLGKRWLLWRL